MLKISMDTVHSKLQREWDDNSLFRNLKDEDIEDIKEFLQNLQSSKMANSIVTFSDEEFEKLKNFEQRIDADGYESIGSKRKQKNIMYRDFLYSKIAGELEKSPDEHAKGVLDFISRADIMEYDDPISFCMSNNTHALFLAIERISCLERFHFKLHFFVDENTPDRLQIAINSLLSSRGPAVAYVYTPCDSLKTYATPDGSIVECPHDYTDYEGVERLKRKVKEPKKNGNN